MQISKGGDAATCRSRGVLQFKLMQFGLSVHAQHYVLCHSNPLVQIERDAMESLHAMSVFCVLLHALAE
jgi:hypothetical protein